MTTKTTMSTPRQRVPYSSTPNQFPLEQRTILTSASVL
jgi:hypothetical protein